jgi:hypothetical protein
MMFELAVKQPQDPSTWIAILLGGFVLLYLSVLRPMMRKKKDPLEQNTPVRTGLAQQRAMEREMQNLLVEYEKLIRNMTAGVDTRAARLEQLIQEAKDAENSLRAALQAAGGNGVPAQQPAAFGPLFSPERESTRPDAADPRVAEVYALADQGLPPRDVARRTGIPHGEIELMLNLRASSSKHSAAAS